MPARTVRWTSHAVAQLAAIIEYIGLVSPVYAEQTLERLVGRLDQACVFPESGRVVPEVGRVDIRELIEPPYRLIYRVHPETIEMLSVLHGRQQFPALP
ncbi:MAG: type II toxin-antitoxin system RelE/ParE family toxin [Gemmatimonadaceae bacterium]